MAILVTGGARSGKSGFAERYAAHIGSGGIYLATCLPHDEEMRERIGQHRDDRQSSGFPWETVEEPYNVAALLDALAERFEADRDGNKEELPASGAGRSEGHAPTGTEGRSGPHPQGRHGGKPPVVLLDCLTLWLTNWLLRSEEPENRLRVPADADGDSHVGQRVQTGRLAAAEPDKERPGKTEENGSCAGNEAMGVQAQSDRATPEADGRSRLEAEIARLADVIARFPYPLIIVTNEVGDGIVPSYPLGRRFRDEAGRLNQRIAALCERVFLVTAGIPVDLKTIAYRLEEL